MRITWIKLALLTFLASMLSHGFAAVDNHVNQKLCATCQDVYQKVQQAQAAVDEIKSELDEAKKQLVDNYKEFGSTEHVSEDYNATKDEIELAENQLEEELRQFKQPKTFIENIKVFLGVSINQANKGKIVKLQQKIAKLKKEIKGFQNTYANQQELAMRITDIRAELKQRQTELRQKKKHTELCRRYGCFMIEDEESYEKLRNAMMKKNPNMSLFKRGSPAEGEQCLDQLSTPPEASLSANQLCRHLDKPYWQGCCRLFKTYYQSAKNYSLIQADLTPYNATPNRRNSCKKACDYYMEIWRVQDYVSQTKEESQTYELKKELHQTNKELQDLSAKMSELQAQLEQRDVPDDIRKSLEERQENVRETMIPLIMKKNKQKGKIYRIEQATPHLCPSHKMEHKHEICYSYCDSLHPELNLNDQTKALMKCEQ